MSCPHTNYKLCLQLDCELWTKCSTDCFLAYHKEFNAIANRDGSHEACSETWTLLGKSVSCGCECHQSKKIISEVAVSHCNCASLLTGHDNNCPNRNKWRNEH